MTVNTERLETNGYGDDNGGGINNNGIAGTIPLLAFVGGALRKANPADVPSDAMLSVKRHLMILLHIAADGNVRSKAGTFGSPGIIGIMSDKPDRVVGIHHSGRPQPISVFQSLLSREEQLGQLCGLHEMTETRLSSAMHKRFLSINYYVDYVVFILLADSDCDQRSGSTNETN